MTISKIWIWFQDLLCTVHHKIQIGLQEMSQAAPGQCHLQSLWSRQLFSDFSKVGASDCGPIKSIAGIGFIKLPASSSSYALYLSRLGAPFVFLFVVSALEVFSQLGLSSLTFTSSALLCACLLHYTLYCIADIELRSLLALSSRLWIPFASD